MFCEKWGLLRSSIITCVIESKWEDFFDPFFDSLFGQNFALNRLETQFLCLNIVHFINFECCSPLNIWLLQLFMQNFNILRKTKNAKKQVFLTLSGVYTLIKKFTKIWTNPIYILANGGQRWQLTYSKRKLRNIKRKWNEIIFLWVGHIFFWPPCNMPCIV